MKDGASYQLRFEGHDPAIEGVSYKHDPLTVRSEAVHVSQTGFRPDDPLKVAFLSLWEGDGGGYSYPAGLAFSLIRESDGKSVYHGKAVMGLAADQVEVPGKVNHNGTDVWRLDFSDFAEPGEYRVYVEGVGCSYAFPIAKDVWEKACWVSVRGLYHRRSGIELGPPYTSYVRPRAFHPDDGVQVLLNKAAYVEAGEWPAARVRLVRLAAGATQGGHPRCLGRLHGCRGFRPPRRAPGCFPVAAGSAGRLPGDGQSGPEHPRERQRLAGPAG